MRAPSPAALAVILSSLTLTACMSQTPVRRPEYRPVIPAAYHTPAPVTGGLFQASTNMELFSDVKARRIGDVITVVLEEKTDAKKSASTNTDKSTELDLPNPTILGRSDITIGGYPVFNLDAESANTFAGSGDSAQSNSLSGNISVTVAAVYPNGNMLIKGEKVMNLNQGAEIIRLSGIVRPADVTPQNTVQSTQIADVQITYSGEGAVADSNEQGWLARFFNNALWPF
jgi:flagellar L-ring protein precursor FlgH